MEGKGWTLPVTSHDPKISINMRNNPSILEMTSYSIDGSLLGVANKRKVVGMSETKLGDPSAAADSYLECMHAAKL